MGDGQLNVTVLDAQTRAEIGGASCIVENDLEWTFDYSLQLPLADPSARVFHLTTGLSVDLAKDLDLDVTFQWDRVANPQQRSDGTFPVPNDFRLSVGVGWSF